MPLCNTGRMRFASGLLFSVDKEEALRLERDVHFVRGGKLIDDAEAKFAVLDGVAELIICFVDIVWADFAIVGRDFGNEKRGFGRFGRSRSGSARRRFGGSWRIRRGICDDRLCALFNGTACGCDRFVFVIAHA